MSESKMYENVGNKIMGLAGVCGVISLVAGILCWLINILNGNPADNSIGWIGLGVGVAGFLSSWVPYGIGQMVEDINVMRTQEKQYNEQLIAELKALRDNAEKQSVQAAPSNELPEL